MWATRIKSAMKSRQIRWLSVFGSSVHTLRFHNRNTDKMIDNDEMDNIDIGILKDFNIFKRRPLRIGQHIEVYKPSSKHHGKVGVVIKKPLIGRVYIRAYNLEEFYCAPSSVRKVMNVQTMPLSDFQDKLVDITELYDSYREFTELLRKHHVDPREEGFIITILSGMIV